MVFSRLLRRVGQSGQRFTGATEALHSEVQNAKVVFVGEDHEQAPVVDLQCSILQSMHEGALASRQQAAASVSLAQSVSASDKTSKPIVHVVMEHFSQDMNDLLEMYQSGELSLHQLKHACDEHWASQGFDIIKYAPLLEFCREEQATIKLHGGFLPRSHARDFMRAIAREDAEEEQEGDTADQVLEQLHSAGYIGFKSLDGLHTPQRDLHYDFFESLLTGRDVFDPAIVRPTERFRKIFPAQVIKDCSMAHYVNELIAREISSAAQGEESGAAIVLTNDGDDDMDADALAHALLDTHDETAKIVGNENVDGQRFLVIAGRGHVQHGLGVPERIFARFPELDGEEGRSLLFVAAKYDDYGIDAMAPSDDIDQAASRIFGGLDADKIVREAAGVVGGLDLASVTGTPKSGGGMPAAADVLLLYGSDGEGIESDGSESSSVSDLDSAAVKAETATAYNKVGSSAHLEGNLKRAHTIMRLLRYTGAQIAQAGTDAYNFQGVGCPFIHARLSEGERVLDVGSGLGVDSFIAREYVGDAGTVVGVDIAQAQVNHAQARATARGVQGNTRFVVGDAESLPFPDGGNELKIDNVIKSDDGQSESSGFDAVISNGAFCLAPNKEVAFSELYRVLKPGGRIAVCTTTIRDDVLPAGVKWPVCMQMFLPLPALQPMLERLGFVNVMIDTSDTRMSFDEDEAAELEAVSVAMETEAQANDDDDNMKNKRHKVHVGRPEFKHLEDINMDQLCARVVVYARKPERAAAH